MSRRTRVGVVGGGAVGLAAADALVSGGGAVTLYERDALGSGTTGRAAGLCYDAYTDRADARLAVRSLEQFRELGVLTESPYVWVGRESDDHAVAAIREQAARLRDRGQDVSLLEPAAIADRFPALRTDHLAVGAVTENAGHVDGRAYVERLAARVEAGGGTIRTDCPVAPVDDRTLETPDGERAFDAVLLAAGPHTGALAAEIDRPIATRTYRAQALVTGPLEGNPPLYYDATDSFYLRPFGEGVLVGDGTGPYDGDPDEVDRSTDEEFRRQSRSRVRAALGFDPVVDRGWAGLCTATPDRNPLLGARSPALYVATGWHGHGLMRAPALGAAIAEEILEDGGIERFDPTRFDGDRSVDLPAGV